MRREEAEFQARMLGRFREAKAEVQKFQDALQGGIADTLVGWEGGGIWVELKWVYEWPKRPGTCPPLKFRPGQVPWLRKWYGKPLPTCVLVGSSDGWTLIKGRDIPSVMRRPWTELLIHPGEPTLLELLAELRKAP